MKALSILLTFSIALLLGCKKDEEEIFPEVPPEIIPTKPCETLYASIMDKFRENKRNIQLYPELFNDQAQKKILITKETSVYVSYISEGATISNSLGWYTYNQSSPPGKSSDFKWEIIFPHVSETVLKRGDMVKLGTGTFAPGTVIGFFLVVNGWSGNGTINFKNQVHFTDYNLNYNQRQQHIMFFEKTCNDIVVGFEDKGLDQGSDADFNDIIFTVSDNNTQLQNTSIELKNVVVL